MGKTIREKGGDLSEIMKMLTEHRCKGVFKHDKIATL